MVPAGDGSRYLYGACIQAGPAPWLGYGWDTLLQEAGAHAVFATPPLPFTKVGSL